MPAREPFYCGKSDVTHVYALVLPPIESSLSGIRFEQAGTLALPWASFLLITQMTRIKAPIQTGPNHFVISGAGPGEAAGKSHTLVTIVARGGIEI